MIKWNQVNERKICFLILRYFNYNSFLNEGELLYTAKVKAVGRRIEIPVNLKEKVSSKEIYCQMSDLNSDFAFELPTINYWRNNGLSYKWLYGVNNYKKPLSICKLNTENPKEIIERVFEQSEDNLVPSEPVFVENPNPQSEDDGVVLVWVLAKENDYLSILDAKNMKEIARANLPSEIKGAMTFHGFFSSETGSFTSLNCRA